ncbi:MAG: arsenite efflux transporter metallochaperone ArsD [Verrucomicrobia bacterium]|nr:arsenite efflux transporter metallochaperone ArsD [Verrucomicrobiota bacterium]
MNTTESETVRQKVREGYGRIAAAEGSCCGSSSSCCGSPAGTAAELAQQVGYTPEELAALPEGANLGLSCGNPNALAALRPGEVVLDLGAGGGFDVFIAGRKVGAAGRVIGVDMTAEMVARARKNAIGYRERSGLDNVEFRLGEIEHLPVADASVDVVISNCVINLSPDKPQVWREVARVLKPGGRVAVSDLALRQPLPSAIRESVEALVGCIAGAVLVTETERLAREAGLAGIQLKAKSNYLDSMVDGQDPLYQKIIEQLPAGTKPGDYITSLEVTAVKPAPAGSGSVTPARLQVFDPALCCSTGVCGPQVDPALVRFAADLQWLAEQGVQVERHNLAQNPAAYVENEAVKQALTERGEAALPFLLVNGREVAAGTYPGRELLAAWCGVATTAPAGRFTPQVAEFVAIGAAIAANCDPCLRYHVHQARELGATLEEVERAIAMAAKVKQASHGSIQRLADRLVKPPAETTADDHEVAAAPAESKERRCCS